MKYIVHHRYKGKTFGGNVNLPAGTECELKGETVCYNGIPICAPKSRIAHQYFTQNEDGNGMERGKLICAITNRLEKRDTHYQERWDKVWENELCRKYKRTEAADFWLWNHEFFNAPTEDLQYIARLVGAKN